MSGFAAGQTITAALLNTLLNPPRFAGYLSSPQSLGSSNSYTAITIDTELYDTANGHSTSTNPTRYTAQVAGLYTVTATCGFISNATGNRAVQIGVNGGSQNIGMRFVATAPASGNMWYGTVTQQIELNVGDYVECMAWQSSGGSLTTATGAPSTPSLVVTWAAPLH